MTESSGRLFGTADCTAAPEVLLGCGGAEVLIPEEGLAALADGGETAIGWRVSMALSEEGDNLAGDL